MNLLIASVVGTLAITAPAKKTKAPNFKLHANCMIMLRDAFPKIKLKSLTVNACSKSGVLATDRSTGIVYEVVANGPVFQVNADGTLTLVAEKP